MKFVLIVCLAMIFMEAASYVLHRFLFHGILWRFHESHHKPHKGFFEANDIFSFGFAAIAIYLMSLGGEAPFESAAFAFGTGMTIFGVGYFVIHDVFVHRRIPSFNSNNRWLVAVRKAHRRHHQTAAKLGQEPFGLFYYKERDLMGVSTIASEHVNARVEQRVEQQIRPQSDNQGA